MVVCTLIRSNSKTFNKILFNNTGNPQFKDPIPNSIGKDFQGLHIHPTILCWKCLILLILFYPCIHKIGNKKITYFFQTRNTHLILLCVIHRIRIHTKNKYNIFIINPFLKDFITNSHPDFFLSSSYLTLLPINNSRISFPLKLEILIKVVIICFS